LSTHPREESGPQRRPTIAHLPALDGLRGAAVIGVLFFHDDRLRGGYLGVDLFFVLSGFLITSLLLAEHRTSGRIDLKAFWIRRARRLFPAVLALVPAVALYAWIFAKPGELARIRGDGIATLAYFANWRTIFAGKSYWDLFSAPSPLEHTWSLCIEEQFYVIWPLLTFLVLRRAKSSSRALLAVSVALALASCAAMWLLFDPDRSSRAYMGTDTRGASILAGAALACLLSGRAPIEGKGKLRALDAAGLAALIGLGVAWATIDGQSRFLYRGGFWLTEAAVLVLIVCAVQDRGSLIARVFSVAPLRWMGLVSYGVYLWHWPLYVVLTKQRLGFEGWGLTALRLAATLAIALISYRFLEQPIRKRGITFGPPLLVVPSAAAASVATLLLATRAIPQPGAPAAAGEPILPFFGQYNDKIRDLPAKEVTPEGTLRVLVVGDSVAVALGDRLRYMQDTGRAKVAVRAAGDCNILDEQHPTKSLNNRRHDGGDCDSSWASDVAELRPDVTLVMLGGGFFAPVEIGGAWRAACDDEWKGAVRAELTRNLSLLGAHGGRVVIARAPYPIEHWASEKWNRATDCWNALVDQVAAASPGVKVLPLKEQLCPGPDHTSCILKSKGALIRPDGMHFEGLGGEDIARWVLGELR
jgi:peptidoglycan/LPS O-acetylase OafA/YrhL